MYEISMKSLKPMLITFFLSSFLYLYHCRIAHMDNFLSNDGKVELRSYIHFLSWVIKTQPRKPFLVVECFRFLSCLYKLCFESKSTSDIGNLPLQRFWKIFEWSRPQMGLQSEYSTCFILKYT